MSFSYRINKNNNLYLNIIDNYRCTNDCVFCDRKKIENNIGKELFISRKPAFEDIKKELYDCEEIVFCGLGEPTLELELLLKTTRYIKENFNSRVRLVTNGHGNLIHGRDILPELKNSGLDCICVSLNAVSKEEYNKLHRPVYNNAFEAAKEFIKNSPVKTIVTFIEFERLDKQKAKELAKSLNANVRFRQLI